MSYKPSWRTYFHVIVALCALLPSLDARALEYLLTVGDIVRVSVYDNPELSMEVRVAESGSISLPLIGQVEVVGLTMSQTETRIASLLREKKFVVNPHVNVLVTRALGNVVSVLGQVNRPGRYSMETGGSRVTEMIAYAGGVAPEGGYVVYVSGLRGGSQFRREIDLESVFRSGDSEDDLVLLGGDVLFVDRAPSFFIYGEVQKPGMYRLEREMTIMQAMAAAGGLTQNAASKRVVVNRRSSSGAVEERSIALSDFVKSNDVVYVRESLF